MVDGTSQWSPSEAIPTPGNFWRRFPRQQGAQTLPIINIQVPVHQLADRFARFATCATCALSTKSRTAEYRTTRKLTVDTIVTSQVVSLRSEQLNLIGGTCVNDFS